MSPKIKKEFVSPGVVPKEAIDFFKSKKLRVGYDYQDVWREENAVAFTVAGVMQEDILESIRDYVLKSLEEGTTYFDFQKNLIPKLVEAGWLGEGRQSPSRLNLVYDANMRTSRATGQWQRIQRTKKLIPYLLYQLGPSERHREEHVGWAGTLLPIDDPWWDSHYPPNGYNCKCHVIQLTKSRADNLGGVTKRPALDLVDWTDKKTGKIHKIPNGIDPGWDYNPGKVSAKERIKIIKNE
jgi:uncharacterized protein with gpF-like domain